MSLAVVGSAIGAIGGLFNSHPKDEGRLRTNAEAYAKALAGDQASLTFLGCRGEVLPRQNVPGYGDTGGWATGTAIDDARAKYYAALSGGAASPVAPQKTNIIDKIGTVAENFASTLGTAAGNAANQGAVGQSAQQVASVTSTVLLVVGIAVAAGVGFYIYKHVK